MKEEMKKKNIEEIRFMEPGRTNMEDRINFVKFWAKFVKTHSDEEWSKQQNFIINSVFRNLKTYLKRQIKVTMLREG